MTYLDPTMKFTEFKAIVEECRFPGYTFHPEYEATTLFLHATYDEKDTVTGVLAEQRTREWVLDGTKVTRSEIVATCFKCIITSMEHKTREWFTYRNKPIYQPHHDVDRLMEITEERKDSQ